MEDKNKIDQFFSNTFEQLSSEEPDWLTPPEHIWESAKEHFPKEKKKSRKFFWIFCGILAASMLTFWLGNDSNSSDEVLSNSRTEIPTSLDAKEELTQSVDNETLVAGIDNEIDKEQSLNLGNTTDKQVDNRIEGISKTINEANKKTVGALKAPKKPQSNSSKETTIIPDQPFFTPPHFQQSTKDSEPSQVSETDTKGITYNNQETLDASSIENLKLPDFSALPTMSSSILNENRLLTPEIASLINVVPNVSRYEIGLTHRQLLINTIDIVEISENSMDQISFADRYFNANIDVRKWITPRWSLQSGVWYSNVGIDLDFSIFSVLDREAKDFLAKELSSFSVRDQLENNDELSTLKLKDGTMLNIGDTINFRSALAIDIKVFQLPFMIDYHMNRRNWEFIVGGGFSMDYFIAKQSAHDLEIYKDSSIANEQFRFGELTESGIDFSVYANAGIRYRISPHVHLGMTTRLMILEPVFSGLEAGIYYRL